MDAVTYPEEVRRLMLAVLDGPGEASKDLRRAAATHAARLGAGHRPALPIPADLEGYVRLVALHAAEVTDEDVAALKQAGYSEDAIFDITVAAALGAGLARLERGLRALPEV